MFFLPSFLPQPAALAVGNSHSEAAMEWVFSHMEDPDFNDPLPDPAAAAATGSGGGGGGDDDADAESVAMLEGMGFNSQQAKAALKVGTKGGRRGFVAFATVFQ